MMNEPIILNEVGAAILAYEDDWRKYCKAVGIVDPFQKRMIIFRERLRPSLVTFGDTEVPCREVRAMTEEQAARMPTQAEIDKYNEQRHLFIASRIFTDIGYDAFEHYAAMNAPYLLDDEIFAPCKSADGQCSLFCTERQKCQ